MKTNELTFDQAVNICATGLAKYFEFDCNSNWPANLKVWVQFHGYFFVENCELRYGYHGGIRKSPLSWILLDYLKRFRYTLVETPTYPARRLAEW